MSTSAPRCSAAITIPSKVLSTAHASPSTGVFNKDKPLHALVNKHAQATWAMVMAEHVTLTPLP